MCFIVSGMDDTAISQVGPQGNVGGGGGKKTFIFIVVAIILVLALIFGGATYLRSRNESIPTPTPFPTEAPSPTPEVSPTPEESPAPTKKTATPTKKPTPTKEATTSAASKGLTVRVLNGSGIAGRAAGLADYLKGLGYEIGGTGNADSEDYDKSTITIKKDKESLLATLKSDVATKYSVGTTSATLSSSASYDAEVVIGKE